MGMVRGHWGWAHAVTLIGDSLPTRARNDPWASFDFAFPFPA
jgi:hypothetical protein